MALKLTSKLLETTFGLFIDFVNVDKFLMGIKIQ
jgi:hypothetical protein